MNEADKGWLIVNTFLCLGNVALAALLVAIRMGWV